MQPAVESLVDASSDQHAVNAILVLDKPVARPTLSVANSSRRVYPLTSWSKAGRAFEFYQLCRELKADTVFIHSQQVNSWCRFASLRAGVTRIFEQHYFPDNPGSTHVQHLHRIPYGIPLEPFAKADDVPLRLRIPGIIMPSGFDGDEHRLLIRAVACLREIRLYPRIFLTGPGSQRAYEQAQQLCNALGLENQVRITRHCSNLPFLLMHHQIAMIARPAQEQILTAQAMAAGCITLGLSQHTSKTLIRNGHDGILCKPDSPELLAEELHRLLTNRMPGQTLADNARARALQEFSLPKMVENYQQIYQHLCSPQSSVSEVA